jgi:hypothetical protein
LALLDFNQDLAEMSFAEMEEIIGGESKDGNLSQRGHRSKDPVKKSNSNILKSTSYIMGMCR